MDEDDDVWFVVVLPLVGGAGPDDGGGSRDPGGAGAAGGVGRTSVRRCHWCSGACGAPVGGGSRGNGRFCGGRGCGGCFCCCCCC